MMKIFWLALFFLTPLIANADTPMSPPSVQKTWSHNRQFFVVTNPSLNQTQVYDVRNPNKARKMWGMPGYFRKLDLSNDGKNLVAGYDGLNLLQLNYRSTDPLVRFYVSGRLIGVVTVAQLFPSRYRYKLVRTVSHYAWGNNKGFDARGRYVVETIDGRTLFYNAATAKQIQ